jgi:hydrogenase nickel insertion protein HypA
MHELSLAQNLLSQLHDLAAQNGADRVIKVTVEIGPLSGIVKDSFQFGFSSLAEDSAITRGAALEIKTQPAEYQCLDCNHLIQNSPDRPQHCPACRSEMIMPKGGSDIILLQVEMDKA